jgi:hypothetical protein
MPIFLGKQPEGPFSGTSHTVTTTSPKVTKKRLGIPVLHCNRQNASSFTKATMSVLESDDRDLTFLPAGTLSLYAQLL